MATNTVRTALASQARTATTTSSIQRNLSDSGCLIVYLNITAASGTGGLQLQVQGVDYATGNAYSIMALPTAKTATGSFAYVVGPSCTFTGGDVAAATSTFVPSQFVIKVTHGDASSYTYSVGYDFPNGQS